MKLFKKVKNKLFKPALEEQNDPEGTLNNMRFKIRADPADHSFTITLSTTLKRGLMVGMYGKMAGRFGEKRELSDMEIQNGFSLPDRFMGLLHQRLAKTYKNIEADTKKDFQATGKDFRFTTITTKSCVFTKQDHDNYGVEVKTEGYWSGSK